MGMCVCGCHLFPVNRISCYSSSQASGERCGVDCQFAGDERQICQMQYVSWPDHGVPDDCTEFLAFVNEVRQCRAGVVESAIIHCRSPTSASSAFWFTNIK